MTQANPKAEKEEALLYLFTKLRALLVPYAAHFSTRIDRAHRYELWTEKKLVIAGRKRKEVFFASIIVQSSYVGFYFMPLYAEQKLSEVFGEKLLATLKGKSCFHLKKRDPTLLQEVKEALKAGFDLYKQRRWIKT